MEQTQTFPQIVNVTDLRYRWPEIVGKLEKNKFPILIIEHSTPKAVLLPFVQTQNTSIISAGDPLEEWRKKYMEQFVNWDATTAIRKLRDSRWNLS